MTRYFLGYICTFLLNCNNKKNNSLHFVLYGSCGVVQACLAGNVIDTYVFFSVQVINVYFELLKEREKREPQNFLKCHFFNTFFYKKVCNLLSFLFILLHFVPGSGCICIICLVFLFFFFYCQNNIY